MEEMQSKVNLSDGSNVTEEDTGVRLELGDLVNIYGYRFRLTEVWLEHDKPPTAYLTSTIEELTKG